MRRLCFSHIQKSAGSSAHAFILEALRADPTFSGDHYQRIWAADFVPMHMDAIRAGTYRFIYGHFDPSPIFDAFDGVFFTIVRNPIDRVVSLFNFCATMDDSMLSGISAVCSPDFTEGTPSTFAMATDMLELVHAVRGGLCFSDFIRLPDQEFPGLESWSDYLAYLPKQGDPRAYAAHFATIGLTDDMAWTLATLGQQMGWQSSPSTIPHVNKSPGAPASLAKLTAEDIETIERRTGFEMELYRIAQELRYGNGRHRSAQR
jgi:hypothetical protein